MQRRTASGFGIARIRLLPVLITVFGLVCATAPAAANEKYAAIVVDGTSGRTIFAENADELRYPASLTKMMTLYVLFEELDAGRLSLNSRLSVSANAAAQAPSKIGVKAGSTITVEDAIQALTTKSANDVAVVVAENVSGSVRDFAARMTRTARALGMSKSTFRNPHGLPDAEQRTTARDMARLGAALQDRFPGYYKFFGVKVFTYKGTRFRNHNRLLGSVAGVDGIKTGYTRASGFNLVSNVRRDGRHIIAVVMGGKTGASRDAHMRNLIAKHLPSAKRGARSEPLVLTDAGEPASVDARLPRPRPDRERKLALVAYAPTTAPRDLVAAAMAETAPAAIVPEPAPRAQPLVADPVEQRILSAVEIAELAGPEHGRNMPIARLTEIARIRAGHKDMVAAPSAAVQSSRAGQAGWHIQIGAVPSIAGAQALIEKAQRSTGDLLASAEPFTQEVDRDGTRLYRARFAGFSGKDEARAACEELKSRSIACLAVPN